MKILSCVALTSVSVLAFPQSFTEHLIDDFSSVSLHAADLNSDGWNDIVAAATGSNIVNWYQNNGDGTFTTNLVTNKPGLGPRAVQIVDINNDGKNDVVVASDLDTSVYWYENDGDENFTEHLVSSSASNVNSIVAMDMDGDQDIDLLTSAFGGFGSTAKVVFFENNGSAVFIEHVLSNGSSFVLNAYPADTTGNSIKDIFIAETQTDSIRHFSQANNHVFTEQMPLATNLDAVTGLFAIDINNDTTENIISASQNDGTLRWHQGSITHTIASNKDTMGAYAVHAADFNFDGDIDVIAAAIDSGTVTYHDNNGSQVFTSTRLSGDTTGATSVTAADMDNNGSLDIISAASTGIRWHENSLSDVVFRSGFE